LRADFYDRVLRDRFLGAAVGTGQFNVLPLSHAELHEAIAAPATVVGRRFEPGLVERIASDVEGEPGNLPLLQFALTQLWERQTPQGVLTHAAYEDLGGVEQALATYAEQVYARLNADEQTQAQHILLQLVQPGEGRTDTRRIASQSELGTAVWPLVVKLADQRLLVTNAPVDTDDPTGDGSDITIEVTHEALIRGWGRLREWMHEARRFRVWQERLRFALRQWEQNERDTGALLRGVPLAEAESWLAERRAEVTEDEQTYIETSVLAREHAHRTKAMTRLKFILSFTALSVLIAVGGMSMALALLAGNSQERLNTQLIASTRFAHERLAVHAAVQRAYVRQMVTAPADRATGAPDLYAAVSNQDTAGLLRALDPYFRIGSIDPTIQRSRLIVVDDHGDTLADIEALSDPVTAQPDDTGYPHLDPSQLRDVLSAMPLTADRASDSHTTLRMLPDSTGADIFYMMTVVPIAKSHRTPIGGIIIATRLEDMLEAVRATSGADVVGIHDPGGTPLASTLAERAADDTFHIPQPDLVALQDASRSHHPVVSTRVLNNRAYQMAYTYLDIQHERVGIVAIGVPRDYVIIRLNEQRLPIVLVAVSVLVIVSSFGFLIARSVE
jgi:hypothetical protein